MIKCLSRLPTEELTGREGRLVVARLGRGGQGADRAVFDVQANSLRRRRLLGLVHLEQAALLAEVHVEAGTGRLDGVLHAPLA